MGRNPTIQNLLKKIIIRKDDEQIEILTNKLISNLQIHDDPNLQLCGDAFQEIIYYWNYKYNQLYERNLEEFNELNDDLDQEIEKSRLYFNALMHTISNNKKNIYTLYYDEFNSIYSYNQSLEIMIPIIDELTKEDIISFLGYSSNNKVKTSHNLERERKRLSGKLSRNEKEVLRNNGGDMTRFIAFLILCFRHRDDIDFNKFIGIKETFNYLNLTKNNERILKNIFNKFDNARKVSNSRNISKQKL